MLAQRAMQQSLRRLAVQHPALRLSTPAAIATGIYHQKRFAAATTISEATEHDKILARQRLNRPVAPHLAIYNAQITWYLSGLNRITGCTLSGAFYIFGSLYLIAPYIGLHMESAAIAASFGAWPLILKIATKAFFAFPFTFHCLNGLRHLSWDTTHLISNQKVIQTGWTVVALSVFSAIGLTLLV